MDQGPDEDSYRSMWNVSVADMDVGYACLNVTGSKIGVETYSEGTYGLWFVCLERGWGWGWGGMHMVSICVGH